MASTWSPSTSRIAFVYSVRLRRCMPGGGRLVAASRSSSFSMKVIMDSITGASGRGMPGRRHHSGAQLAHHFFADLGVVVQLGEVELIEHQPGSFQTLIVAGDAILVEQCALGGGRSRQHGGNCGSLLRAGGLDKTRQGDHPEHSRKA